MLRRSFKTGFFHSLGFLVYSIKSIPNFFLDLERNLNSKSHFPLRRGQVRNAIVFTLLFFKRLTLVIKMLTIFVIKLDIFIVVSILVSAEIDALANARLLFEIVIFIISFLKKRLAWCYPTRSRTLINCACKHNPLKIMMILLMAVIIIMQILS